MKRDPLTQQRSPWEPLPTRGHFMGIPNVALERRVHDGRLLAIIDELPTGWHMSISHRDNRGQLTRYPSWDEIAHARDQLLPPKVGFVMHLPTADDYVALHATTFHLHEYPERKEP